MRTQELYDAAALHRRCTVAGLNGIERHASFGAILLLLILTGCAAGAGQAFRVRPATDPALQQPACRSTARYSAQQPPRRRISLGLDPSVPMVPSSDPRVGAGVSGCLAVWALRPQRGYERYSMSYPLQAM